MPFFLAPIAAPERNHNYARKSPEPLEARPTPPRNKRDFAGSFDSIMRPLKQKIRRMAPLCAMLQVFSFMPFACDSRTVTDYLDAIEADDARLRLGIDVSGLVGSRLRLESYGEYLEANGNGIYLFDRNFRRNENFQISIASQPQTPSQFCTLEKTTGVIKNRETIVRATCFFGSSAGPLVGGTIIQPLNIQGNADMILGEWFAGSQGIAGTTDAPGTASRLNEPVGLTTDGQYLYVQEASGARNVRRINPETREVTTLGVSGGSDGIATDGEYLYTPDFTNCAIYKMSLATNVSGLLAGQSGTCGMADSPTGPGATARFNNPIAITYADGYLYVSDYGNNRIRRIDAVSGATITIAGTGAAGAANGPGNTATFNAPHAIFCYQNRLYIGEFSNYSVRVINLLDASFPVSTFSGSGAAGNADGPANVAQFRRPGFFTTDGTYLYVSDILNYAIRRIDLVTGNVTTISGHDTRQDGAIGSGGILGTAAFERPKGLVSDGRYLYMADSRDHTIRRIE